MQKLFGDLSCSCRDAKIYHLAPNIEYGGESHEFGIKDIELRNRETVRSASKNLLGLIKMSFTFCSLVIPVNAGPSQSQEHREIRSAMRLVDTR